MKKKEKIFYATTGFVVTLGFAVVVCLTLVLTGVVTMPKETLKIRSVDASKYYDGSPLKSSDDYMLIDGELEEGHEIIIRTMGSQTQVGTSDNFFSVLIRDTKTGRDVTSHYEIIKVCGKLTVYG